MEQVLIPYHAVQSLGPARVLALAPHPDDEVFGCGGALARHGAAGDPVRVVLVTDGDYLEEGDRIPYAAQRREESRAAAVLLGYAPPCFWGLPDRGVSYGDALVRRILAAIIELDADLVYAPSPLEVHPDHWALSLATIEAVRRYSGTLRLALYEVGMPLHPNLLLDISDLAVRKQAAMACFRSQLAHQPYDVQIAALNRFRTYTLGREVQAVEAYRVIPGGAAQADLLGLYAGDYLRRPVETRGGAPLAEGAWASQRRALEEQNQALIQQLQEDLRLAEERWRALLASHSWRITAPLRALSRSLRKLGR